MRVAARCGCSASEVFSDLERSAELLLCGWMALQPHQAVAYYDHAGPTRLDEPPRPCLENMEITIAAFNDDGLILRRGFQESG
jgi:hypothetical protein